MPKSRATDGQFEKVETKPHIPSPETQKKNQEAVARAEQAQLVNRLVGDKGMPATQASAAAQKHLKK